MRLFVASIVLAGCTAASTEPEPQPAVMVKIVNQTETSNASREPTTTKVVPNDSFNKGAAARALGSVDVRSCAKADGPTGSGHVTVIFATDGTVSKASVDDDTFPGTAVGGCIAGKFRSATVPPFTGNDVRVGKSFKLEPRGT